MLFCERFRSLARTRKFVKLLLRRKATIGADFNVLRQRLDEGKMLMCLRMTDEMERRAGLCVSMNGMHPDWSLMMVAALLGKSASLRVMFFARVISYRRKCRLEPRFVKVCNAFASNLAKKIFAYEGAILMPIAFPCIVKSICQQRRSCS